MKRNPKLLTRRKNSGIVYQSKIKSKIVSSVRNTSKPYSAMVSKGVSSIAYSRKFPDDYTNRIVCGDSLSIMREMPSNSIDVVVTSPPYNLKISTGNGMKDGRGGKWAGAALVNGYATQEMKDSIIEICNHCGKDVSFSSGLFVNRVPDLNDIATRIANNLPFPLGDFVCDFCDQNSLTNNE